jgi:hypothetical protein
MPARSFGFEKRQKEHAREAKRKKRLAARERRRQNRAAPAEPVDTPPAEADSEVAKPDDGS